MIKLLPLVAINATDMLLVWPPRFFLCSNVRNSEICFFFTNCCKNWVVLKLLVDVFMYSSCSWCRWFTFTPAVLSSLVIAVYAPSAEVFMYLFSSQHEESYEHRHMAIVRLREVSAAASIATCNPDSRHLLWLVPSAQMSKPAFINMLILKYS